MELALRKWPGRAGLRPHPVTFGPGTLPQRSKFSPTLAPSEKILESVRRCSWERGLLHDEILPEAQTLDGADLPRVPPLKGWEGAHQVEGKNLYRLRLCPQMCLMPQTHPHSPAGPAPRRKVAGGPGQRPEGWGRTPSQDRAQKGGVSLLTIFVCSIQGGAVERQGGAAMGRGSVGGGGRSGNKAAGEAAGRTRRDPPTETDRNSETEKRRGGGGGGAWARERLRERMRSGGPRRRGWERLDPQPRGRPDPRPTHVPALGGDTRARARAHTPLRRRRPGPRPPRGARAAPCPPGPLPRRGLRDPFPPLTSVPAPPPPPLPPRRAGARGRGRGPRRPRPAPPPGPA